MPAAAEDPADPVGSGAGVARAVARATCTRGTVRGGGQRTGRCRSRRRRSTSGCPSWRGCRRRAAWSIWGAGRGRSWLPSAATTLARTWWDRSLAALRRARWRLAGHLGPVGLVAADLRAPLPLADACVEAVVSYTTLECLPDPAAVLREVARVLRPGSGGRFTSRVRSSPVRSSPGTRSLVPGRMLALRRHDRWSAAIAQFLARGGDADPALARDVHAAAARFAVHGVGEWLTRDGEWYDPHSVPERSPRTCVVRRRCSSTRRPAG